MILSPSSQMRWGNHPPLTEYSTPCESITSGWEKHSNVLAKHMKTSVELILMWKFNLTWKKLYSTCHNLLFYKSFCSKCFWQLNAWGYPLKLFSISQLTFKRFCFWKPLMRDAIWKNEKKNPTTDSWEKVGNVPKTPLYTIVFKYWRSHHKRKIEVPFVSWRADLPKVVRNCSIFSPTLQNVHSKKSMTSIDKISFELKYLENKVDNLKFLTSIWRQWWSKVIGKIWNK